MECKYRMHMKKKDRECIKYECQGYQKVTGLDPQSGAEIDYFMCEDSLVVKLLIENTAKQIRTAKAIEALRTVVDNKNPVVIPHTGNRQIR